MDLLVNILTAAVLAAAFPLGFLLYEWSKDEVDAVVKKFPWLKWANKLTLALSAGTGIIAVWATTEILLVLFIINLAVSSVGLRSWRESLRPALELAVPFLGIKYILLSAR
ncbi:MAG: hypothetical protein HYT16_04500 [DPANN group archaeon]|nr:hypothetical protein [DPANN group archaeon]